VIEFRSLTKIYGGNSRPAVSELSMNVNDGEVLGFAGLNGAGKTTTIRMAAGIIYPTSGTVLVDGKDIVKEKVQASMNIGWVPEFPNFEPNAKPLTLLKYYAGFYGIRADDAVRRGKELLDMFDLGDEVNKKLKNYSQGMKKRFSLVAALLPDPKNLLLDETLNGLDPEGIRFMRKFLADLRSKGKAILLSSHILTELENTADRVAVIHKGKLLEIIEREKLTSITSDGGKLEDYFFKLIGG